ncbi:hypothetical protein GCM10011352_21280 [Marinobacterium zhoushanense]|uniref:VOC domain-containing protein n=1 Tax=Marinobacterium zhoushanense TaxID=1679163 RepID=A0ABQ1KBT2_9GAMM|nr:glyoxalase [Marinobacterium zhoushanense]GGB94925.1 hypothetical protein GCM10011352_21280 [Marinobacterium zhoushanense]
MPEHYFERCNSLDAPVFEGVEFVEIATRNRVALESLLLSLGFAAQAKHRSKEVTLYRQGNINLLLNSTEGSFAAKYAASHGSAVCALGLRTANASSAYQNLIARGAWETATSAGAMELNIPAIESIGGSQIYLIDRYADGISIYDIDFKAIPDAPADPGLLQNLRELRLTMEPERLAPWRDFFRQLFGFQADSANSIVIDTHTGLRFEANGRPDLLDERIDTLVFTAEDLEKTRAHLVTQGLELRTVEGAQKMFEVLTPSDTLSIRILIAS